MNSRRILITGVSSPWGGHLAQALERQPGVDAIVGIDTEEPRHELQRTEFVGIETDPDALRRILPAARIDTVIDTRLQADPLVAPLERAEEVNLTGTRNLLLACATPGSPVRKLVFKSSAHAYGTDPRDPMFLGELGPRHAAPRTEVERQVAEAEAAVAEFSAARPGVVVTVLRFAEALGTELRSSLLWLLGLPAVPAILGFDPRWQFIHEDDVVAALTHAAAHRLPGVYNAAADGVLTLSEVSSLLGKPLLPVLPPWGTELAAGQLRRLGLPMPLELLRLLRTGRGLDNRRLKATGFSYRYTTREAVLKLRAQQRLRPLLGSGGQSYRYQREVEEFLRRSPSVRDGPPPPAGGESANGLAALDEGELLEIVASLDDDALRRLRRYEAEHGRRERLMAELDRRLARSG